MQTPVLLAAVLLLAGCAGTDETTESPTATSPATITASTSASGTPTPEPPLPPAPPTPPGPSPMAPFTMAGARCRELLVLVPVTMAQARTVVPANYTPVADAAGQATAFAGLKVCDDLTLDGVAAGPGSTSDVGVLVNSPDGSEGTHYYQAWWATDHLILADLLAAQGWRGGWANTSLAHAATAALGEAEALVDWPDGPYSLRGTFAAAPITPEGDYTGWHDGPRGTLTVRKTLTSTAFGSGQGAVTAAGPLAGLVGASASGPAIWNEYGMVNAVGPEA